MKSRLTISCCILLLTVFFSCRKEIIPLPEANSEIKADIIIPNPCFIGNCWTALNPFPQTKPSIEGIFTINGVTYLSYENYDPSPEFMLAFNGTDWSQTAFPTVPQTDCPLMFSIGNRGYALFSGMSENLTLQEFDPSTGIWSPKANYPGTGETPSYNKKSFVIGDNAYIINHNFYTNSFELWQYNQPANSWTQKANLPKPSGMLPVDFAFALDGKGYVMFRVSQQQSLQIPPSVSLFYSYDIVSNSWTPRAAYPGDRRNDVTGFVIGNYAYVGTGKLAFTLTNQSSFNRYDATNNQWTSVASYKGGPTKKGIGFSIGNYGYLLDFYNATLPSGGNYFYRYKPSTVILQN